MNVETLRCELRQEHLLLMQFKAVQCSPPYRFQVFNII